MIDKKARSLFVVGDEKQCIYAFRGSKVDLILQFHKFFPNVKEVVLNQNYRSTQPILDIAHKVITHNTKQKHIPLFTEDPQIEKKVKYYLARNEKDEAEFIVKTLSEKFLNSENENNVSFSNNSKNEYETQKEDIEEEITFVPDNSNSISSMFDIYLNADDLSQVKTGSNLWNSYGGLGEAYNPSSWKLKDLNWKNVPLNKVAILYRTHAQSRAIEETLLKYRVPYKLVSGTRFLDRKEVKDVLSILRFVNNGNDKLALSRFLPLILPGVGAKTMEKIYSYLQDPEFNLPQRYLEMVETVLTQISTLFTSNDKLIDFTKNLIAEIGYIDYLKNEYPNKDEFNMRMENISELYSLMLPYDQDENLHISDKLVEFLNQIMLLSNLESKDKSDDGQEKINLMTLHQSKGLEFEIVFLVGCEDGILPHQNSLIEIDGFEEEVRLAYVGITRAKKDLFLLAADSRVQFGQVKSNPVSRIFRPVLDSHAKRVR
jgi:superfamily I DNA/RNA helicase